MIASRFISALACAGLITVGAATLPTARGDEPVNVTGQERIVDGLIPVTGAEEDSGRLDLRIGFQVNSAKLTEAGRRQLDELAAALGTARLVQIRVGLHGHTDASGPANYNMALSQRRAEAALRYLVEQRDIAPGRLDAAGFGERRLRSDLPAEAAGQRRVEVVNLTPDRVRRARSDDAVDQDQAPGTDGDSRDNGGASAITQ